MERYLDLALVAVSVLAVGVTLAMKIASDAFDRAHSPRD